MTPRTPLACLLLAAAAFAPLIALADTTRGIHVSGRGTLEVEPDMGYVQLTVRREGMDAARLKRELDAVVKAVLELAEGLSIERRDITATALTVAPRYQRRNNETVVEGLVVPHVGRSRCARRVPLRRQWAPAPQPVSDQDLRAG